MRDLRKPRSKKALWTVSLSSRVMTLSAMPGCFVHTTSRK